MITILFVIKNAYKKRTASTKFGQYLTITLLSRKTTSNPTTV